MKFAVRLTRIVKRLMASVVARLQHSVNYSYLYYRALINIDVILTLLLQHSCSLHQYFYFISRLSSNIGSKNVIVVIIQDRSITILI